ncbi:MAG: TlyA family RNA methyltransferase [Deltaproteobacteria bacterium]|jgi:23S rRNA (cytidine1920-2'-O)/16S rRNA (cytidine1409-2'-O)-methyltransferase|nr:TlyA family RNA methyltransferase [Deltaproteobacteria bacterium]
MSVKIRADELVVAQKLGENRNKAKALIMAGRIFGPDGRRIEKPGQFLDPALILRLSEGRRFVSRAGFKLNGALEELKIDPSGFNCLDLGASTGGFTDCLLQKGARAVTAVDVGRSLLDATLRADGRVKVIENLNARYLDQVDPVETLGAPFDLIVADLSFISLELILPQASPLLTKDGRILAMVKPQFEVGRNQVGKGGIVRDMALVTAAVDKIAALGPRLVPPMIEKARSWSKLTGKDGNQEVFLLFSFASG